VFPRWVLITTAVVVLAGCAPHLWLSATTPAHLHYVGSWEYVHDQNTYLMWARQVQDGRLLVYDLDTTEDHPPLLPSLPWLIVGLLGRVMPLMWAYHGLRVVSGVACLLAAWGLIARYFEDPTRRMFAFVIIAAGSGFKALTDLANHLAGGPVITTADAMPELWSFHSLAVEPHFALSLALMAGLAWTLLESCRRPTWRLAVIAVALTGLLALVHPFDMVVWGPLLVVHLILVRLRERRIAWVNLAALAGIAPAAGFLLWQMNTNPIFEAWAGQNILPSPPMLQYMLGFGAALVLAVSGLFILVHRARWTCADHLIVLWVALTVVAVNAGPLIEFERRCIEGVHIPLALLAAIGVTGWLLPWMRERWKLNETRARRLGLALLLVCILPTNIKLIADGCVSSEAIIPADWVQAFEWIEATTPEDARLLAAPMTGNHAAVIAGRRVYVGHTQQTIDFAAKARAVALFFDADTPTQQRRDILIASGCGWVVAHDAQRNVTGTLPELTEVFANDTVTVCRVDR
jgi:hypothetical protein